MGLNESTEFVDIFHDGKERDPSRPKMGFCTKKGEMAPWSMEGLISRDKDRRSSLVSFQGTYTLIAGQIEGECPGGTFVGTGQIFRNQDYGVQSILTCAHNVVGLTVTKSWVPFRNLFFYNQRLGPDTFTGKIPLVKAVVHPKYDGSPACGYDIAVCFAKDKNFNTTQNASNDTPENYGTYEEVGYRSRANAEELTPELALEICGYPGDKDGYPYVHQGPFVGAMQTKLGGCIITYKVDTTPGQSGSKVTVVDEEWVAAEKKREPAPWKTEKHRKCTVAIHTGNDPVGGVNFGTLITEEIHLWLRNVVEDYSEMQK